MIFTQKFLYAVICSPVSMGNGDVSYNQSPQNDGNYPVNTRASFKCNALYYLNGPSSSTCTTERVWGDIPTCEKGKKMTLFMTEMV